MRNIKTIKGRLKELIVEGDVQSIMIEDEQSKSTTYVLNEDTRIMNDEHFVSLNFESLAIHLPVYLYVEDDTLLFIIIAQNEDSLFQIIDVFDDKLVSVNKMVKINDTYLNLVMDKNFQAPVKSLLANQQLLVFYHVATKSIPALVNPVKIIIL